jgi:hypothetical protein
MFGLGDDHVPLVRVVPPIDVRIQRTFGASTLSVARCRCEGDAVRRVADVLTALRA